MPSAFLLYILYPENQASSASVTKLALVSAEVARWRQHQLGSLTIAPPGLKCEMGRSFFHSIPYSSWITCAWRDMSRATPIPTSSLCSMLLFGAPTTSYALPYMFPSVSIFKGCIFEHGMELVSRVGRSIAR